MIIVNSYGGPCSGKSTLSFALAAYFKNRGIRAEFVGESAKTLIWEGRQHVLGGTSGDQTLVIALQFNRLYELERNGCDVAISDGPLLNSIPYCAGSPFYRELRELVIKMHGMFPSLNVFVRRVKPYMVFGRTQGTEKEARLIDVKMRELMSELGLGFDFEDDGDEAGQTRLCEDIFRRTMLMQHQLSQVLKNQENHDPSPMRMGLGDRVF